jgi:hypothetical protein
MSLSLYLWSIVVVVPLTYVVVVIVQNYRVFRRRAKFLNMLPGKPPHWLTGHLHNVCRPTPYSVLNFLHVVVSDLYVNVIIILRQVASISTAKMVFLR